MAIAIVAFLIAVAVPIFRSAMTKAQSTQCIGQLRQLAALIALYQGDNNGQFPAASGFFFANQIGWTGAWYNPAPSWGAPGLAAYVDLETLRKISVCPSRRPVSSTGGSNPIPQGFPYAVNYHLMPTSGFNISTILSLHKPSTFILMTDSFLNQDGSGWRAGFNGYATGGWLTSIGAPHAEVTTNILWADGHVSSIPIGSIKQENILPQ